MKFLRLLLNCLVLVIVLAAILVAAAFVPMVQTRIAQMALAGKSGLQASLGSLSARSGKVDIADLHLEFDGASLTLPSLQAALPLTTAAWERKALVRSVVAKGWTLDLSHVFAPADARAQAVSAAGEAGAAGSAAQVETNPVQEVARIFRGLLGGWKLPCDLSLDGVDLEGDVLLAALPGGTPARVHLTVKGGGLTAGREGVFAIDAGSEVMGPQFRVIDFAARGRLVAAMESPRTLSRVEFKADLSAAGGSLPENLAWSADLAVARGAGEETYTLGLGRGSRQFATFLAHSSDATLRLAGTWKVDLRDSDLAPFAPDRPLPSLAAAGEGDFDTDTDFTQVHARGRLRAVAGHLGVFAAPLDQVGAVTLDALFDLTRSGRSIRVDRLSVSLAGVRPAAVVQSLQPFDFDERTGRFKVSDPAKDWMEGSMREFPLAWLSGLMGRFAFTGGAATGGFVVRAADGGFTLRPKMPLTAAGVSVQTGGRTLGRGLDLSLSLLADYAPDGWHVQWAPFTIDSGGRRLAASEGKASRTGGADEPIAISGTWNADLERLVSQSGTPGIPWIRGRSASGDFSASLGTQTVVEGTLAVAGHDPGRSVTASVRAEVHADGAVTFLAPVKIAFGSNVSEVSAEGKWTDEGPGARVDLRLTGENVALEQLRLLATPLAAAGGILLPATLANRDGAPQAGGVRDRIPFWGNWMGRMTVSFDRLRTGDRDLSDVGGTFDIEHGTIRLTGGRGGLPHHPPAKVEGTLSFDAAAKFPYSLKATGAIDEVDAAPLFAAPLPGQEPVIEGRFSIAATVTGNGINLEDLAGRTQEEFRLKSVSTGGIIRLLKTSVAEAIPQVSTPVADTVGAVGSFMGSLLGRKGDPLEAGKNPVSKNADAVLNFTNQVSEIGYDQITVTAIRGFDGTIHLVEIAMIAPDERLTGSGEIASVKGLSLAARPLGMDLRFGARGDIAGLLQTADLLSSEKDKLGYTLLKQPVHFGGSVEHIDISQWHDLLVKAATRKPEGGKKGG